MPDRAVSLAVMIRLAAVSTGLIFGAAAAAPPATKPSDAGQPAADAAPPATRPAAHSFPVGASVEVKWGGAWSAATIKNIRGEWYLVTYDRGRSLEWVEPWRVRAVGSSYDISHATPNRSMLPSKIEPPPRERPGPPRGLTGGRDDGAAAAVAAADAAGRYAPTGITWPVTDVDVGAARLAPTGATPWGYAPPAVAATTPRQAAVALQGGATNGVHERTVAFDVNGTVAFDVNGTVALLVYRNTFVPKLPYAELVDLAAGRPVWRAAFSVDTLPMSVAPDGRRVAGTGGESSTSRVDVWDIAPGAEPRHVVSFEPYAKTGALWTDVERVLVVDATHLLTINVGGHLIAWEVGPGTARATWQARLPVSANTVASVTLSPDRKTFAAEAGRWLLLGDAVDGTPRGTIETSAGGLASLSFRPDGRRLCAIGGPTLYEFDLESGKQTAALGLPAKLAPAACWHLAGDAVLLPIPDASFVILDVAGRAIVGRYKAGDVQNFATAGDRLLGSMVSDDREVPVDERRTLCAWPVPATRKPPTSLATVSTGPGTKVTLDVQIEADDVTRKSVVEALTKQIVARGWTVGEPADVRVVARTLTGASDQRAGGPQAALPESMLATQLITRLSVEVNGKPAWSRQWSYSARDLAIRYAGTPGRPAAGGPPPYDVSFLKTVSLPETIFVPIDALPASVATYTLTSSGVRPN